MAWRGLFLATAAAVAVLTVAAVAAEEPASQPTPAPAPLDSPSDSGWSWHPTPFQRFEGLVLSVWKHDVLALLVLGYFIAGLRKHRHDWKPLVLGLFGLGLGALETTWALIDGLSYLVSKGGGGAVGICAIAGASLFTLYIGLIVGLLGGLFTVILRWRNERFRKREAQAAAETEAEAEG
jgi:hypothetical protein